MYGAHHHSRRLYASQTPIDCQRRPGGLPAGAIGRRLPARPFGAASAGIEHHARINWNGDRGISANEEVEADMVLSLGTWYHIAVTYDGSAIDCDEGLIGAPPLRVNILRHDLLPGAGLAGNENRNIVRPVTIGQI